mmetsp:Transcript_138921/g.443204  ORF Transcript_138921/g.443204 Transcript_138921/m.443204 type:complete len:227 (-) Transcript_138921:261-941(-)
MPGHRGRALRVAHRAWEELLAEGGVATRLEPGRLLDRALPIARHIMYPDLPLSAANLAPLQQLFGLGRLGRVSECNEGVPEPVSSALCHWVCALGSEVCGLTRPVTLSLYMPDVRLRHRQVAFPQHMLQSLHAGEVRRNVPEPQQLTSLCESCSLSGRPRWLLCTAGNGAAREGPRSVNNRLSLPALCGGQVLSTIQGRLPQMLEQVVPRGKAFPTTVTLKGTHSD